MRRFLLNVALMLFGAFGAGCTMSDRDFVRNHIVLVTDQKQSLLLTAATPPATPRARR